MSNYSSFFSKFLKGTAALWLLVLSAFPAFAVRDDVPRHNIKIKRKLLKSKNLEEVTPPKRILKGQKATIGDVELTSTGKAENVELLERGAIKVKTDNNKLASYQLEGKRFDVKPGDTIKIPYQIAVENGGKISLGLLNTARRGWYPMKGVPSKHELILGPGLHTGTYETLVPEGESLASLVIRNYHLSKPGQSIFTINNLELEKEKVTEIPEKGAIPVAPPPPPVFVPKVISPQKKDVKVPQKAPTRSSEHTEIFNILTKELQKRRKRLEKPLSEPPMEVEKEKTSSKTLTLKEKLAKNETSILEKEKKVRELTPAANLDPMGGFTRESRAHNLKRRNAKNTIKSLEKEIAGLKSINEKLAKQAEEKEKKDQRVKKAQASLGTYGKGKESDILKVKLRKTPTKEKEAEAGKKRGNLADILWEKMKGKAEADDKQYSDDEDEWSVDEDEWEK